MNDETSKSNPVPNVDDDDSPPPTPAVVKDPSAKAVRKLEEKISKLEDLLAAEKTQREDMQIKFNLLSKVPGKEKGKSVLQELDDFIFGKEKENE
ncbi:hypothetical protein L0244_39310 [bacterium]|nr:hypothetical protein [bacterium]